MLIYNKDNGRKVKVILKKNIEYADNNKYWNEFRRMNHMIFKIPMLMHWVGQMFWNNVGSILLAAVSSNCK